jgi:hypothetical protein
MSINHRRRNEDLLRQILLDGNLRCSCEVDYHMGPRLLGGDERERGDRKERSRAGPSLDPPGRPQLAVGKDSGVRRTCCFLILRSRVDMGPRLLGGDDRGRG